MYKTYFNFWLLCLICFWIYALFLNQGSETSTWLSVAVVFLILLGVIFFILFIVFFKRRFGLMLTSVVSVVLTMSATGISAWTLATSNINDLDTEIRDGSSTATHSPKLKLSPTKSTPTITIEPKKVNTVDSQPTSDPNEPIHCPISDKCGGGTTPLKRWECEQSICCQIGGKWVFYRDKKQCISDQKAQNNNIDYRVPSSNYQPSSYPPCVVYYPALGISKTYYYLSPEECQSSQNSVKQNVYTKDTLDPTPTPDLAAQRKAEQEFEDACNEVVSAWNDYKVDFMANEINEFSSSAEGVIELARRMQIFQQELTTAGCPNTLSL